MASRTNVGVLCSVLMIVACSAQPASGSLPTQSAFALDWTNVQVNPPEVSFFMAMNPRVTENVLDASLVMANVPPCAMRTMHIHMNTDEIHYVLTGRFLAMVAYPNGTVVSDEINAGQSFAAPKNYVHSLINPSCSENAIFLGFYNHFNAANNNIAAAARNMVDSPFIAYADRTKRPSLAAATAGSFSYDPLCLTRCRLGSRGGQEPTAIGY